jgi:hypothetical protein
MPQDITEGKIPPYIGWGTWQRLLEGLKTFNPPYLDRSYFDSLGFSGTQRSQAVRTLLFLGLISEIKRPTDKLQLLLTANTDDYTRIFREILQVAYKPFFDDPGPQNATIGALEDYLRGKGAKGGVVDKCITFFLKAAKEVGIPLSPQLSRELGRGSGRGLSTMRKTTSKPARAVSSEGVNNQLAQSLVEKFPDFDPNWSDDLRQKWFEAFQELLKRIR